jgi:hypothetical protein
MQIAKRNPCCYGNAPERAIKKPFRVPPKLPTAGTITIAMMPAIIAYSIAVTADSKPVTF